MPSSLAVLDREVDRLDHVGRLAGAVRIEHLQVDQVRGRRHARIGAVDGVVEAARRDDAGDVRAVAVEVVAAGRWRSVKSKLAITRFCSAG